ncbi:MAG: PAS domain S-box protein, partial [Deltaproteobacteria bacterium]|nr:PAS domain S-box protein [Deltaproteobacteria bacterium]
MNLENLINNIITSGHEVADPDILRKYKVLNIFQLTVIFLAPLLGIFYVYIGAISLFYTSIAAGILMIAGILLLRITKNLILSGNYALFVLWAVISILSWKTGAISYDGIINPTWLLNAGLILLAIFLNGYLSGTVWAIIIFIQTGVIIFLFRKGYQFASIIPADLTATYFLGVYLICLLTILLFAFLFEKEKIDALMREENKSQTIREGKRYMDSIFDRYPLPTFVIDKRHRVIQWNRACSEISGLPPEEMLGKEVWKGFHMGGQDRSMADILIDDSDSISDLYKDEIVSSERGWFELNTYLPGLDEDGRVIITAAPILDDNDNIRGAIQTIQTVKQIPVEAGVQDYLS